MRSGMRYWAAFLLIVLIALSGCVSLPALTVTLETPTNGGSVPSLTPMLAWSCSGPANSYHLQVASDANFQSVIIDVINLGNVSYTIPLGNLSPDQTYYWRVSATTDGRASGWSAYSSFKTQAIRGTTVKVNATVDGAPWSGTVNYTISGARTDSSSSVPMNFTELPVGTYTITYNSGAPPGATLVSIIPSPTQTLPSGGTITFTLNFHKQVTSAIMVKATVDGTPWSGAVNYSISGLKADAGYTVPQNLDNYPAGIYILTYNYGGPAGATLVSITPSPTQSLSTGGAINFTLNFQRQLTGVITVNAVVDGSPWSGPCNYTITGPATNYGTSTPQNFVNQPAGVYTLTYNSGGPPGAMITGITPSPTQSLSTGGAINFTLNFQRQLTGVITVNAVVDGSPWSGPCNYTITGPATNYGTSTPQNFVNQPAGVYTLTYNSGGPPGAMITGITPSPTQKLSTGGAINFTLNFQRQFVGTIVVNATLDGAPWRVAIGSGVVNYTVTGPRTESSSTIPQTFSSCPSGTYTLTYSSGGPIGATLASITPSPSQNLPSGGTIVFTMNFHGQAKGSVTVMAVIDGQPWSGSVSYTLNGPYVDSGYSVPETFSNCPQGIYTLSYMSGGPPSTVLERITPGPTQSLAPGGSVTFTLHFHFVGLPQEPGLLK